jgi:FkbM family methyltransferase
MTLEKLKKLTERYSFVKTILFPAIFIRRYFIKKVNKQEIQRQIIDNLYELIDNDIIIKVNEFNGKFFMNPHSDLFYRVVTTKSYEPEIVKLCMKYIDKNKDMIDVGANIGFFTVLFAKHIEDGNKVLSIEPTKNGITYLRCNIALNEIEKKVDIFEGAASNINGTAMIETIEGKEEYSSLGNIKYPGFEKERFSKEKVVCVTLDTLVKEKKSNPGFIKIDVEGSEHLVIQGARHILLKNRPIILSEICESFLSKSGSSARELVELISSYNYRVYDVDNPSVVLKKGAKRFPVSSNIICFPKEMTVKL